MADVVDEKNGGYNAHTTAPTYDLDAVNMVKPRGNSIQMGEAADMYGDVQTAEQYGYVSRGLSKLLLPFPFLFRLEVGMECAHTMAEED